MIRAKCDQTEWGIDTFDEYILGSVFFSLSFGLQLNSQLWEKQTPTINSKLSKKKKKKKKRRSAELLQLCHDDRSWWNVSNSWLLLTMSSWATWLLFVERVVKVSRCRRKWGKRGFTTGWDEGEVLVLAPFSLAVADVEVDVDRSGQPLVPVGGNLDQEAVLQQRQVILLNHYTKTINYHNCITLYPAISILVSCKFLLSP